MLQFTHEYELRWKQPAIQKNLLEKLDKKNNIVYLSVDLTLKTVMAETRKRYEFAVIATDIVIFTIKDEELNVLLVKMKKELFKGSWAIPGGLVKPNESVDSSAKRNLFERTKMKDIYLEQLYTFGEIGRDPYGRVVSVAYFSLIPSSDQRAKTFEDNNDTEWFPVNHLPGLAYDHDRIIHFAVDRLRGKLAYTNIAYGLLPEEFTFSELQRIYEIILCRKLDKRNFRKKILGLKLISKTGKKTSGQAHRPAHIFRFTQRSPRIIQIL